MIFVKITDVKANIVKGNFEWVIVRVETDENITGVGEAYCGAGVKEAIVKGLKPLIIGEDPLNIDRLYHLMYRLMAGYHSIAGTVVAAISGIEIALWDIKGKALGIPIYSLLGGKFRDNVRIYCDSGKGDKYTPESYAELAREVKKLHFTAYKFDIDGLFTLFGTEYYKGTPGNELKDRFNRCLSSLDLAHMVEIVKAIRTELGERIELALDCHWSYTVKDAIRLAQKLKEFNLLWLEDPVPAENIESMATVTKSVKIPTCTGENLYTGHGFLELITKQATRIIAPDIPKVGGMWEAKKIAWLADLYYIPFAPHNIAGPIGTMASAHVCASVPNFLVLEFHGRDVIWWNDLIKQKPLIKDGYIKVTNKPGLGIDINETFLKDRMEKDEKW